MTPSLTKDQLEALAETKFQEVIEDEVLDSLNSDDITVLFAMLAQRSAQYSADAIDW